MTKKGAIVRLSKSYAGSVHDLSVRRSSTPLPPGTQVYADSGYLGLQKEHKKTKIPIKKQKGQQHTKEASAHNKALSSYRITIEHKIRALKIFQILAKIYPSGILL